MASFPSSFRGPSKPRSRKRAAHFAIVKSMSCRRESDNSRALSGQQHDVSAAGFFHGHAMAFSPVWLDQIFASGSAVPQ